MLTEYPLDIPEGQSFTLYYKSLQPDSYFIVSYNHETGSVTRTWRNGLRVGDRDKTVPDRYAEDPLAWVQHIHNTAMQMEYPFYYLTDPLAFESDVIEMQKVASA